MSNRWIEEQEKATKEAERQRSSEYYILKKGRWTKVLKEEYERVCKKVSEE